MHMTRREALFVAAAILVILLMTLLYFSSSISSARTAPAMPAASSSPLPTSEVTSILRKELAAHDAISVMPLGDSLTAGVGSSDRGGYREMLSEKIKENGWNMSFVGSELDGPSTMADRYNEGHPGWRIDQISNKVESWLQAEHPQIILLHIGTNDIIQGGSPTLAATRLTRLLNQITATSPTALVLVAQIIPLGYPSLNKNIIAYDRMIPNIVRGMDTMGKHIVPVDMYDVVPVNDLRDHIHPDDVGYALMANAWYQALSSSILTTH